MDVIAGLSNAERNALFTETANRRGLNAQIIEKDFWACWTLVQLFKLADINKHLIFKGGTSLSKIYKVIERFSEDIDVAIDKKYLGFGGEYDLRTFSAKDRDKIVSDLDNACKETVQNFVFSALIESFSKVIGEQTVGKWQLEIDEADPYGQTILFAYPRENSLIAGLDYIKPIVRIELGARPENQPVEKHLIESYAAEEFPQMFENPGSEITILSVERTFWEKATILHDQYHRADDYRTADRISRHYYDFYKLVKADVSKSAIENFALLESVVINKKSFFYRAGAKYEEVLLGHIHLIPSPARLDALKRDYEKMNSMFFAKSPEFNEILELLAELEKEINLKFS